MFPPHRVVLVRTLATAEPLDALSAVAQGKSAVEGVTALYVCQRGVCQQPVTDPRGTLEVGLRPGERWTARVGRSLRTGVRSPRPGVARRAWTNLRRYRQIDGQRPGRTCRGCRLPRAGRVWRNCGRASRNAGKSGAGAGGSVSAASSRGRQVRWQIGVAHGHGLANGCRQTPGILAQSCRQRAAARAQREMFGELFAPTVGDLRVQRRGQQEQQR